MLKSGEATFSNSKTSAEHHYRKGRCYQKLNQPKEATSELKKAIYLGSNLKLYFASSAALQLGLIKKNTGQLDSARYYLRLVETFPGSPYKSSIEMKAAAILNSLN
jgi:tetratricopeptide (TPR) repeat protein